MQKKQVGKEREETRACDKNSSIKLPKVCVPTNSSASSGIYPLPELSTLSRNISVFYKRQYDRVFHKLTDELMDLSLMTVLEITSNRNRI